MRNFQWYPSKSRTHLNLTVQVEGEVLAPLSRTDYHPIKHMYLLGFVSKEFKKAIKIIILKPNLLNTNNQHCVISNDFTLKDFY
jgi:hypothetical protein